VVNASKYIKFQSRPLRFSKPATRVETGQYPIARAEAEHIAEQIAALRAQLAGNPAEDDDTAPVAVIEPPVKRIRH